MLASPTPHPSFPPQTATIIIPVIINIWNITSGFMISKNDIPNFWIWLYWLNPTQFALKALLTIAFLCDTASPSCSSPPSCATDPSACPSCSCPRLSDSGDVFVWDYLDTARSLSTTSVGLCILALCGFILVFRVLSGFGLRFLRYNRR